MASDLDITLQFLKRHLDASTSTEMTETIEGILRWATSVTTEQHSDHVSRAIHEEVGSVRIRRGRGVSSRILAYVDEDMMRHYRRIEQQFHRLQVSYTCFLCLIRYLISPIARGWHGQLAR